MSHAQTMQRYGSTITLRLILAVAAVMAITACKPEEAPDDEVQARPVRTVEVIEKKLGKTVTLAGTVESQVQVDLAFRIGGRLEERAIGVGDTVEAGQLIARLDPSDEENGLRAAEASLPTSGVVAAIAFAVSTPTPGIDASRRLTSLCL